MSVIDFTQDEGANPNDDSTLRHSDLNRNEAKCAVCWRIFFKGELVKFRVVNGKTTRGVYCPNGIKHLETKEEYLVHLETVNKLLGRPMTKTQYENSAKEWVRHSIRKGRSKVESIGIADTTDANKLSVAEYKKKQLLKEQEVMKSQYMMKLNTLNYSVDDKVSAEFLNKMRDNQALVDSLDKIIKELEGRIKNG
ncbi:MAG: hypothetical protein CME98_02925 [Hyphomonas sp.]|jgi:hypothetical protein|nr:hypothetical protein [Hyphomonas sp.]|tara:strand:- start:100 stop:684 length:585 start_codon:yes stop_codon:yes gene_type:complete